MIISCVELNHSHETDFWSRRPAVTICRGWFCENFFIPNNLRAVRLDVHDKPGKDRYAFSPCVHSKWVAVHETPKHEIGCYMDLFNWLKREGLEPGTIYYAEVWY